MYYVVELNGTLVKQINCKLIKSSLFFLEHHSKTPKQSSVTSPYNWTPVYNPPPNVSPKLYKLVRNIQMASLDEEPSIEKIISNDDNIETDGFSILDESDQVKV